MQEFEAMVCCLLLFNGRFVWYQLLIPTIMCSGSQVEDSCLPANPPEPSVTERHTSKD